MTTKQLKQYAQERRLNLMRYTDRFWLTIIFLVFLWFLWTVNPFGRLSKMVPIIIFLMAIILYGQILKQQKKNNVSIITKDLARSVFATKLEQHHEQYYLAYGCQIYEIDGIFQGRNRQSYFSKCFLMEDNQLVSRQQVQEALNGHDKAVLVANTDFSQAAKEYVQQKNEGDWLLLSQQTLLDKMERWQALASEEEMAQFLSDRYKIAQDVTPQKSAAMAFLWGTVLLALSLWLEPFYCYFLPSLLLYGIGYYRSVKIILHKS